jgi:glutamate N-acetyltransferase/amino-acid N-acetyltransferase
MKLPEGFRYSSTFAGIRNVAKDDVALIVSDRPAACAAVFTTNRVVAAPVVVARKNARGRVRAILVNAGNANCATRTGVRVVDDCLRAAAGGLGIRSQEILPASTGVIGVEMDASLIVHAMPRLIEGLSANRFEDVVRAMMTTDTRMKTAFAPGIAGMTKGSGMIHPRMATTLGFVMTDAVLSAAELRPMLRRAIARSYNRISVDGDMSTNDTVAVLANGMSGKRPSLKKFEASLTEVLESLAIQIVRDGEGARKLVTIDVRGASNDSAAEKIARTIANSPLVKTAIAGSDPNWGRIICAAGYAGVAFDPSAVEIAVQGVTVCRTGLAAEFSEDKVKKQMDAPECALGFTIRGRGKGRARFWTCDFTEEYIRINGSYRT